MNQIRSTSSKTQNSFDYDFDNIVDRVSIKKSMNFIPSNIENQNTPNNVEEVLEVVVEGLRPKRKNHHTYNN